MSVETVAEILFTNPQLEPFFWSWHTNVKVLWTGPPPSHADLLECCITKINPQDIFDDQDLHLRRSSLASFKHQMEAQSKNSLPTSEAP